MSDKKINIGSKEIFFEKSKAGFRAEYESEAINGRFVHLIEQKTKDLFPESYAVSVRISPNDETILIIINVIIEL